MWTIQDLTEFYKSMPMCMIILMPRILGIRPDSLVLFVRRTRSFSIVYQRIVRLCGHGIFVFDMACSLIFHPLRKSIGSAWIGKLQCLDDHGILVDMIVIVVINRCICRLRVIFIHRDPCLRRLKSITKISCQIKNGIVALGTIISIGLSFPRFTFTGNPSFKRRW